MMPVELTERDLLILSPCETLTIGKGQSEYQPLPIARVVTRRDVPVISRWTFTDEERAAGADIYLSMFTFDQPPMPILPGLGCPLFDGAQVEPRA